MSFCGPWPESQRGARARRSWRALLFAPLLLLAPGCQRACGGPSRIATDAAVDAGPPADGGIAATRCHAVGRDLALGAGPDTLVGEAVADAKTIYVGLLRRGAKGRMASVAVVPLDLASPPRFVDLGPARGDDPAPHPFLLGGEAHVAYYDGEKPDGGAPRAGRDLLVARVQDAHVRARIPQPEDESLAFDVATSGAGAVLVWDDDDAIVAEAIDVTTPRAAADAGTRLGVVAPGTDVDVFAPRVVPRASGGYWVAWLARKPEPEEDGAEPPLEGAGEVRSFTWIDVVAIDEHGARVGQAQHATSAHGHVSGFDLTSGPGAAWLVAASGEETREGEGGRLLVGELFQDKPDGPLAALTAVVGAVGRGAPDALLLPGGASLVGYVDVQEHARLLPVAAPSGPPGDLRPSAEPWLEGGRLLLAVPPGPTVLALVPAASEALVGDAGTAIPPSGAISEALSAEPVFRRVDCN